MPDLCVLLVEDDEALRRRLLGVLQRLGSRITESAGGTRLLEALAEDGPFDLVVAAVRAPSPDGLHTLSLARTVGNDTPFLVLTDPDDAATRARASELGRSEWLEKPFEDEEFLRRVRRLVRVPAEVSRENEGRAGSGRPARGGGEACGDS